MRVAVVGRSGQLAQCLVERAHGRGVAVVAAGRPDLDLGREASILPALEAIAPDVVVNAAAMTAVDMAESDVALSLAVNKRGAELVAAAATALDVPVIHVSTDYVFDGAAGRAYAETDMPNPLSVYGASKLGGERAVAEANPRHLIVRTAWVHSPFGSNFVRAILSKAAWAEEIEVVADQVGSPTSGLELADALLHAARRLPAGEAPCGLYHVAGEGATSRADQARAVLEASRRLGGPYARVRDVATGAAGQRAPRPRNSSLSSETFAAAFGWRMRPWEEGIAEVVARLVAEGDSVAGTPG